MRNSQHSNCDAFVDQLKCHPSFGDQFFGFEESQTLSEDIVMKKNEDEDIVDALEVFFGFHCKCNLSVSHKR